MSKKWLMAALMAAATPAAAHEWYPMECCHNQDCAAVDKVEMVPTPAATGSENGSQRPSMRVTTRHGTVVVPSSFPRRESKDHRMHACMLPGEGGKMRLICIFMPPSM
jgi:hypothetical protein